MIIVTLRIDLGKNLNSVVGPECGGAGRSAPTRQANDPGRARGQGFTVYRRDGGVLWSTSCWPSLRRERT